MPDTQAPVVLAIGGHDPVGGAGIQADIEAIAALGGHAATAVTCLTVQDTRDVQQLVSMAPDLVRQQADAVLADLPVAAIKIGLIGDAAIASMLGQLLTQHPNIPVVLDPVLAAGGGTALADAELKRALIEQVLPRVDLVTPNSQEARALTGADSLDECARRLLDTGCGGVLITGGHESGDRVINRLYQAKTGLIVSSDWERLPNDYHGSGCTLAAAIAVLLAQGLETAAAVEKAQAFTWQSLAQGQRLGHGQLLPNRLFRLATGEPE